mmetsp:Transcript_54709/g.152683  ORF Transcript_54709/g.152683 Transcript_54709/m.152683 type:complete len:386 (-) Transcript_54709:328-1485(-)
MVRGHVRLLLRHGGAVRPRRRPGPRRHGDGGRQEQGHEGGGHPRPRLLRQAAGADLPGVQGPRSAGRDRGDARGRDSPGAHGLHVGQEARHGAQAGQLHLLHCGRPRRGAEVLRRDDHRGLRPGPGHRRRPVAAVVPPPVAPRVHQVHRDDPHGHRRPRPRRQRRAQHHRDRARGQGPGVGPLQRPAHHRPALRRGAGRRREDVQRGIRQRRHPEGLHRQVQEEQPARHGHRAPHQVPGQPGPARGPDQGVREEALQVDPDPGLRAGGGADHDTEARQPHPERRRLHRRLLRRHDQVLWRLLEGGVRRADEFRLPERTLRARPLHRLHRPLLGPASPEAAAVPPPVGRHHVHPGARRQQLSWPHGCLEAPDRARPLAFATDQIIK